MGSGRAASGTLSKINSETNLAVQLLLSVSDGNKINNSKLTSMKSSIHPYSSIEHPIDTGDETDSTDCAISTVASPDLQKKQKVIASSPHFKSVHLTNISKNHHSNTTTTIFKYSREERLEALQRFREKKRRRQFSKRVRYMVRKRLAETRPRYKGRFSKPPPGETYDDGTPGPPANTTPTSSSSSTTTTTSPKKDDTKHAKSVTKQVTLKQ